jgi:hypothetical protein
MHIKKSYQINQLRDYSSLFSRSEVNKWCKNDFTSLKSKAYRYDIQLFNNKTSYLSYLKHIYRILEKFYPNEYVYKNEFINKWLKSELGKLDSVVYNEFRLGKAVADMVMFNGNSKVFEIKTLLDKDSRLGNQLLQYAKIFNEVYVIIPKTKIEKYISVDAHIGIITYDESIGNFTLFRSSEKNEFIDVNTLMQVLHTNEYIQIVEHYFGFKPLFNDFNKFDVCKTFIQQIPHVFLHEHFTMLMKQRKINNTFSEEAKHLNQIFLSLNLSSPAQTALLNNLRSTITN